MNTLSRFETLADDDLDQITGGAVDCGVTRAVASAYYAAGDVMESLGYGNTAAKFYGKAEGVKQFCHS